MLAELLGRVGQLEASARVGGGSCGHLDKMDEEPIESPLDSVEDYEEMEAKLTDKAFIVEELNRESGLESEFRTTTLTSQF